MSGGSFARRIATAAIFTAAAVGTTAALYALMAHFGRVARLAWPASIVAMVVAWMSFKWHLSRPKHFPLEMERVQARRALVLKGLPGWVYFGAILGPGWFTQKITPLVLVGIPLSLSQTTQAAAAYGAAFALGRSTPAWRAVWSSGITPSEIGSWFVRRSSFDKIAGVVVAATLAYVLTFQVAGSTSL